MAPTRLDIIAEHLLRALATAEAPDRPGFVYRVNGGDREGDEVLIELASRELADVEARRLERERACKLAFVRQQPAPSAPARAATARRKK